MILKKKKHIREDGIFDYSGAVQGKPAKATSKSGISLG